jgi:hypothetical protein
MKVITNEHILQVYEWMNNRPERIRISASDAAIQLDHSLNCVETKTTWRVQEF